MGFDICNIFHGLKPMLVMMVVQFSFAGVNVFYKLAINDGMSMRVMVAYRYIFATVVIGPIAFFVERNIRPKLTWMVVFQAFLCGLFGGTLVQNLYVASLHLTSATFASAMCNLIPAVTFIMAMACGLEKLGIRHTGGKAKVLGTLIGIGGAMLLTFYKGIEIKIWSTDALHIHNSQGGGHTIDSSNRLWGAFLALCSCLSFSTWLIIQTKMSARYPCCMSSTILMCSMGAIQATVYALCVDQDMALWKLGWNIRLLSVSFSGVMGSGLTVALIAWCVNVRGPVFVSVFNPLMLVLVAIAGAVLLDERLHLGTILGAALIVFGLYMVLWGKANEMKRLTQLVPAKSSPLDQSPGLIEVVITPSSPSSTAHSDNRNATSTTTTRKIDQNNTEITSSHNFEKSESREISKSEFDDSEEGEEVSSAFTVMR
ncbi:hypothetical protein GIB67_036121 [Kingdonia uniflora]|uniref:EamA domain-containing protein n=1 Tax=Kingdonia uniflora TaxID=39325 RepID=A0A7J7N8V4_9MAGN|nr:hypothetical protein GIB67_036121 [Kingdonia uniflora]